jgi:hypothetical protein
MASLWVWTCREGGGGKEGRREGGKEGRREGGKEGRREGGKEGRREGGKEGRGTWFWFCCMTSDQTTFSITAP